MITVTLYTSEQCPDCAQAEEDLQSLQSVVPHQLEKVNVDQVPHMKDKAGLRLPLVEIGPYHLQPPFTRQDLQIMLGAARDRVEQIDRVDQAAFQDQAGRGVTLSSSDRITYWLSRHYLAMVNVLLLLFAGLPFLAPVMMKNGVTLPARIIYKVYSPMCHQLAFRSWFLFGQQAFYPRQLAGIPGVTPYEVLEDSQQIDLLAARDFVGNDTVGYKVALCQRDVAIYGFMFLFGVIFWLFRRKLPQIPWFLWVLIGLVPIGLDGVSQLPSFTTGLPGWLPMRESTPLLRTITGGLFGWMTAWYLYPLLEETARETYRIVNRKVAFLQQQAKMQQSQG